MFAVLSNDEIKVYDAFLHKETIRSIEGRRYDADDKAWCVPISEKNVSTLSILGAQLDEYLQKLVKIEIVIGNEEQPMQPMLIKAIPYRHQVRAYNFALNLFGVAKRGESSE